MIDQVTYNGYRRTAVITRHPGNERAKRYSIQLHWQGRIQTTTRTQYEGNFAGARDVARSWVAGR